MIQEDEKLLIKDLCARLPYSVRCSFGVDDAIYEICGINPSSCGASEIQATHIKSGINGDFKLTSCKPYLFPLSSMTKEQSVELFNLFGINLVDSIGTDYIKINECTGITFFLDKGFDIETHLDKLLDWLNKNHFDYRGLIGKGLAIDATGLNIYL